MNLGIAGRTALVCASSKGLGYACASALAKAGVMTMINGRNAVSLEQAAERLRTQTGGRIEAIVADLASKEGREALLADCPAPDILVTNNGGPPAQPVAEVDRSALLEALEMNLLAATTLIQAVIVGMASRGFGRIVNITSVAVEIPVAGLATSSVARAGLTAFSAALAQNYAPRNVTINCIEPGFFATDRIASLAGNGSDDAEKLAVVEERFDLAVPAWRLGRPDELGALCAFLCSDHAGYITGQRLLIDGGLVGRI